MSTSPPQILDTALDYTRRGWAVIPIAHRSKHPGSLLGDGWQNTRLTEAELPRHFNGQPRNIGVILGPPSGDLVDYDMDSIEAVRLAPYLAPDTGARFGRLSKPHSHRLFVSSECKPAKYIDPTDGATILEIRTSYVNDAGELKGQQTILPGSAHDKTGEPIEWDSDDAPFEIAADELHGYTAVHAACALLAKHWPGQGGRHDTSLFTAGGLIRAGWTEQRTKEFIEAIARVTGDDQTDDRLTAVATTAAKAATGEHYAGWKTLLERGLIDERVIRTACKWLSIKGRALEDDTAASFYYVKDGCLCYDTANKKTGEVTTHVIADFEARISEHVIPEHGAKLYRITGKAVRGGDFTAEIPAEDFADGRKLKAVLQAAAGPLDPIWARQSEHLGPALITRTNGDLRHIRAYQRTGWTDDKFLIPGREPDGVTIGLPHNLPYNISTTADLSQGLEALRALLEAMSPCLTTIVLSTIFQAPLAQPAGWRGERYGLFITGRTGSLKSSYAQTAMCLYGPDFARDELLIKWGEGATRNAIMALATRAHDLPLLIDNYKPNTGRGKDDFTNLIHNILEGGEKARLTRTAELRESRPVFCWPIVTGEDVPSNDPASLARILVVPFAWPQGQTNNTLAQAQAKAAHLSAVGRVWLEWLESKDGQETASKARAKFQELRGEWAKELRQTRSDMVNVLRVASNLASNQLTWLVLTQHPTLGAIATAHKAAHEQGLQAIAKGMATYTAEALEATRLLDALNELITSGKSILLERGQPPKPTEAEILNGKGNPADRVIGWEDSEGVYLLFDIAKDAALRVLGREGLNNLSNQALFSQLDGLGLIAQKATDGKTSRVVKVYPARTERVLHLKPEALNRSEV